MCSFTRITSTGPTLNIEDRSESKNEWALTMELKFECPICGQHISATPEQIGGTGPCPNCKTAVTVPNASTLPPSRPPSPQPPSPPVAQVAAPVYSPPVKASIKRAS